MFSKLKTIVFSSFFVLLSFFLAGQAKAEVNAYFFYSNGCPHCATEEIYFEEVLKDKYPDLKIYEFEIYNNRKNALLLQEAASKLGVGVDGVPFLIIGNEHFVGFSNSLSPEMIEEKVEECLQNSCPDSIAALAGVEVSEEDNVFYGDQKEEVEEDLNKEKIIDVPFLGKINTLDFSLPVLTIVLGALDGFNPCAMWVLLFLISLLLGIKDRRKMWILGTAFIVSSAFVYFLFMVAWLNLILFLGFVIWVRLLIGVLALAGGGYSLKEALFNRDDGCKVASSEKKQKIFQRMKAAISQNNLFLAVFGIVLLAFAVNLVELICSAGLPAIYAQVLALNEMAGWRYYLYILLYIFFFMLDDLFIFFVAMITLKMTGITTKYTRLSRLIGGLLMLIIGLLLIFKPEWLMFG